LTQALKAATVRIALVGLPGSGKSTVGQHLARRLNLPFADSDRLIEERIGCSIREFFEQQGEAVFRDEEERAIADLSSGPAMVVATGGGAVLRDANRRALHHGCHVIYLRTTPEHVYQRLQNDRQRPLLQVADPLARLDTLFKERDPLYREVAHQVIETGRSRVPALVQAIATQLEMDGVLSPPADS
jgi:shikimate kinase